MIMCLLTALAVGHFLAKYSLLTLPQPLCLPDLTPSDVLYSLKSKLSLKEEDFRQWKKMPLM
jgi:hypothetical protein